LPILKDVSLFLPANTFIVGSSGSGKSTIVQLLLSLYEPQGVITLNESDVKFLDEEWMRRHVASVSQQGASGVVILDGTSLFKNVAIGARFSIARARLRNPTVFKLILGKCPFHFDLG
jgi:ATP-binding cassette subfamily B (MDR/TAP) protein 1